MIEMFIAENLEKDIQAFESLDHLYKRYKEFCKFHKLEVLSKRTFSFRLNNVCYGTRHTKTVNYKPIRGRQGMRLLPCKY